MRSNGLVVFGFFACLLYSTAALGQSDVRPWEKLGLSQTEWKMIQENKISERKIHELLSAGISIREYCAKSWERLHISERSWVEKRRAGLTQYDIELELGTSRGGLKGDSRAVRQSEYNAFSSGQNVLISFLLPGFQQLRLDQNVRGGIMGTLALGSIATCFIASMLEGSFQAAPLYYVLPADMLWSFVDFKITLWRERSE